VSKYSLTVKSHSSEFTATNAAAVATTAVIVSLRYCLGLAVDFVSLPVKTVF
jgi:hypothetical protein